MMTLFSSWNPLFNFSFLCVSVLIFNYISHHVICWTRETLNETLRSALISVFANKFGSFILKTNCLFCVYVIVKFDIRWVMISFGVVFHHSKAHMAKEHTDLTFLLTDQLTYTHRFSLCRSAQTFFRIEANFIFNLDFDRNKFANFSLLLFLFHQLQFQYWFVCFDVSTFVVFTLTVSAFIYFLLLLFFVVVSIHSFVWSISLKRDNIQQVNII